MIMINIHILVWLQSALGWEHQTELSKHGSQTDAAKGFGGKYGVQRDRQDQVHVLCIETLSVLKQCFPGGYPAFFLF